jgi:hypothetical protein
LAVIEVLDILRDGIAGLGLILKLPMRTSSFFSELKKHSTGTLS